MGARPLPTEEAAPDSDWRGRLRLRHIYHGRSDWNDYKATSFVPADTHDARSGRPEQIRSAFS